MSNFQTSYQNYKQATPYVKSSPAITGISGVRSNFILPFGSWLFTQKSSSHKKIGQRHGPQQKKAVTTFLLDVNENQLILWTNQLNVV
jgi:hypothetical protein